MSIASMALQAGDEPVSARDGGWIITYSGRPFWVFDPKPADVSIVDLAHHLSLMTRWVGATKYPYSVAQHCVLASLRCKTLLGQQYALVHDSPEAYIGDLPTPLKHDPRFAFFRECERNIMVAICDALGLPHDAPPEVKMTDRRLLATEYRDLIGERDRTGWSTDAEPYAEHIFPWEPRVAEAKFLAQFNAIFPVHIRSKVA